MRDFEEKSYYEIQLDNKQLILVFLAGVTVCVLVFILGVMVGKGKKEAEMAANSRNESIATSKPSPDLTQPQDVQSLNDDESKQDKSTRKNKKEKGTEEAHPKETVKLEEPAYAGLDKNDTETPLTPAPAANTTQKKPEEALKEVADKTQEPAPEPTTPAAASTPNGGKFTVQVMATGSREKAEQQLNSLKTKGYTAFMTEEKTGSGASVFKVRVGKFADSDSAKKIATRLKQELKLETWVAVLD